MKSPRILPCLLAIFIVTGFGVVAHARQDYPTKPITLLIPYPPGTGNDIVGRLVGNKVSTYVGQRVVAENRAGIEGCTRRVNESVRGAGVRLAGGTGCLSQGECGDVE